MLSSVTVVTTFLHALAHDQSSKYSMAIHLHQPPLLPHTSEHEKTPRNVNRL
jgi:hypothetical protein